MILRSGRAKSSLVPERRKRPGQVPMTTLGEVRFNGTGPIPPQYAKYEFDISRPSEAFYESNLEVLQRIAQRSIAITLEDPDFYLRYAPYLWLAAQRR